jgi:hypothetical protein
MMEILVHGATALHCKLATRIDLLVPDRPSISTSLIWNAEFVQLPWPGAPENRVH